MESTDVSVANPWLVATENCAVQISLHLRADNSILKHAYRSILPPLMKTEPHFINCSFPIERKGYQTSRDWFNGSCYIVTKPTTLQNQTIVNRQHINNVNLLWSHSASFTHLTVQNTRTLTDLLNFMYGVSGFFGGTAAIGNLAVTSVCKSLSGTGGRDMEMLVILVVEPFCCRGGWVDDGDIWWPSTTLQQITDTLPYLQHRCTCTTLLRYKII